MKSLVARQPSVFSGMVDSKETYRYPTLLPGSSSWIDEINAIDRVERSRKGDSDSGGGTERNVFLSNASTGFQFVGC